MEREIHEDLITINGGFEKNAIPFDKWTMINRSILIKYDKNELEGIRKFSNLETTNEVPICINLLI